MGLPDRMLVTDYKELGCPTHRKTERKKTTEQDDEEKGRRPRRRGRRRRGRGKTTFRDFLMVFVHFSTAKEPRRSPEAAPHKPLLHIFAKEVA